MPEQNEPATEHLPLPGNVLVGLMVAAVSSVEVQFQRELINGALGLSCSEVGFSVVNPFAGGAEGRAGFGFGRVLFRVFLPLPLPLKGSSDTTFCNM